LTFNVVFISAQRKAGFVASWRESASITSAGDLSAHHFPTKSASPPAEGSITS